MYGADTVITNQIGQAVVYKHYHYDNLDGGKQEIYITDVNLNDPTVSIRFPYLTAKRTVTAHAATVANAAVVVNGQFFDSSGSVQFLKVSGSVIYQSDANVHDEQAVFDDGLGHTNSIGIALRPGAINSWTNSTWPNIMACGVELVKNGVKILDSGYDANDPFVTVENPRTCVAWTYDNHLLLMCVDGRSVNAHGMSIYELRDDIYTRGSIRHAFSFDSGGSTEMWARGIGVCNVPSDGSERPVADAVVIASAPAPPATLAATAAITNIALSWSASIGATSYNLKRSTTNGGPYVTITNTTVTTCTNKGLALGTTFYYVVSAVSSAGESSDSSQAAATTASGPPAPGNLTAAPGDSLVALSWDPVPGALSYHLKRSTTNGGSYSVIANLASTGYTNSGLVNGTTYYYVVSALNSVGEGSNSSQVAATPAAPPPAPGHLTATAGNGLVALGWDAVPGAVSYHLKRSTTNGGSYSVIANLVSTSYTNTGLSNATTYYYVVSALNNVLEGADSGQAFATPQCAVPAAPAGLTATTSNGQIALNWGAVAGATNYAVYRAATLGGSYTALATNLAGISYSDVTAGVGAVSFYLVRAMGSCGTSVDSSVASAPLLVTDRAVSGNNFVMNGWGGVAGQTFYVLGSTNVVAPVSQWARLATNLFGPSGSFNFTDTINPALPQQFYLIQTTAP